MTDVPYPDEIERLVENIRSEITAQLAMAGIELPPGTVERLASGIATNIDYAFSVQWRPRWVKGDEPHRWCETDQTGAEQHFVECLRCKRITAHATADAGSAWFAEHEQGHA